MPPRSDGRAPGASSGLLETPNQFQSLVGLSGTITNRSTATNAGTIVLVALRTRAGAPYVGTSASYLFGQIIPLPDTDEYGVSLALTNPVGTRPPTTPEAYWQAEPESANAHTEAGYYWSPHAETAYAAKPGAISITWRKIEPSTPVGTPLGVTTMVDPNDGRTYTHLTQQEIVSPAPVKPPRRMYWTEGPFAQLGRAISIPTDRIKDIKIIYNDQFPQFTSLTPVIVTNLVQDGTNFVSVVATNLVRLEYPFDGTQEGAFAITNTLWYNRTLNSLQAYNLQDRRVFVEFLGDKRGQLGGLDIHQQLGYEIVEVIQRPIAADVTTELGERLTPFQGASPAGTPTLLADPILNLGQEFIYQHSVAGTPELDYYAVRETQNQNDYQMHWMEEGLQGLRWPYRYVRYKMIWPGDVAKYSHYVRPVAATESEASSTAVALPAQNAPQIAYQDPLDQPRGKLTENFAYYSWLTPEYPAHRALLRFTAGEYVRFERVFSWLDENLKTTNFTGTVAANLTSVADYPSAQANYASYLVASNAYQIAYANYLTALSNYPAALARGVNNVWELQLSTDVGAVASITSWAMVVETATPGTAFRFTNEFAGTGLTIPDEGGGFSPVTVSGITNAVTAIWIKLNGLMSTRPEITEVWLGRLPTTFTSIMGLQGGTVAVTNLNLVFDDRAAAQIGGNLASGAYRPRSILANMLLPAPTVPSAPIAPVPQPFPTLWPSDFVAPRVVNSLAVIGQRIGAPAGELGSGLDTNYLAGYIRASEGDRYHPGAYIDPFVSGFDLANQGTIIPVNAIPGQNLIEVWWFRKNQVDATRGFRNVFWPSVIGRYTTGWPTDASEIILASNDGSGALPSLEAKGGIYVQNDPSQPGYNPNEEHALMQGGQAYALRDDLNLTAATVPAVLASPGATYSSEPFVLLDYTESDGKRAIRPFRVRREKPEAGITFEYQKRAAQILQPPMPLPLLGPPFAPKLPGIPRKGLNEEYVASTVSGSLRDAVTLSLWTLTTDSSHGFLPFRALVLQNLGENPATTRWFFGTNVTDDTVEGLISTNPPAAVAFPVNASGTTPGFFTVTYKLVKAPAAPIPAGYALLASPSSAQSVGASTVGCPGCAADEVAVAFAFGSNPVPDWLGASDLILVPAGGSFANNAFNGWRLGWNVMPFTASDLERQRFYADATFTDRKGNVWVYRGPHVPSVQESFTMRFYYNTLPGFFFPTLASDAQPPAGTVTPYLRKKVQSGGFVGDAVYGNADADQEGDRNSLPIAYHPYWPADAPVLQMAETLTTPKRGLPAVRGQSSLQVLYQQSQLEMINGRLTIDGSKTSVVLHDPTREKIVDFNPNSEVEKSRFEQRAVGIGIDA